jgi:alkanesulfonate monooxygenase SsuD/methylene tetrahydromethanopterin reductase-like flavin-dependent oxidoreductase (luciferase family)
MTGTPLAVLDLVPISSGSPAAQALRHSVDLAQAAERFGYARYWFAEHHLNPGVAGTSPAVAAALTAAATSTTRIGSGAMQTGHRTALSVVEEFGLIDARHPGRLDLGLGRSAGRPKPGEGQGPQAARPPQTERHRSANGLLIPERFAVGHLLGSPRAFRPGADLDRPYVSVSADVVVASDEAAARELAVGYGLWVRSIRSGEGAIPFPTPEQGRTHRWTDADRAMVADRVDTQFTGSPKQVADQLEQLQEATGADELIITTITHDHADRVRSYQLASAYCTGFAATSAPPSVGGSSTLKECSPVWISTSVTPTSVPWAVNRACAFAGSSATAWRVSAMSELSDIADLPGRGGPASRQGRNAAILYNVARLCQEGGVRYPAGAITGAPATYRAR